MENTHAKDIDLINYLTKALENQVKFEGDRISIIADTYSYLGPYVTSSFSGTGNRFFNFPNNRIVSPDKIFNLDYHVGQYHKKSEKKSNVSKIVPVRNLDLILQEV